jgi:hypothetical protein
MERRAEESGTGRGEAPPVRHVYGPRAVSALLPAVTRAAFRKHGPALGSLISDWPVVVGPAIAALTEPVKLAQGTLTIACTGPAALELQHVAPQILERVNAHLAGGAAKRLRIVQRAIGQAPNPAPPPVVPQRARRAAQAAVDKLPEGPVREALRLLGEAVLARGPSRSRRGPATKS